MLDETSAVGAKDHFVRPELHHQRQARTFVPRPIDDKGLVAMLDLAFASQTEKAEVPSNPVSLRPRKENIG
jgi:hypothetical protein